MNLKNLVPSLFPKPAPSVTLYASTSLTGAAISLKSGTYSRLSIPANMTQFAAAKIGPYTQLTINTGSALVVPNNKATPMRYTFSKPIPSSTVDLIAIAQTSSVNESFSQDDKTNWMSISSSILLIIIIIAVSVYFLKKHK
jgi:ATP-dependent Zn protease